MHKLPITLVPGDVVVTRDGFAMGSSYLIKHLGLMFYPARTFFGALVRRLRSARHALEVAVTRRGMMHASEKLAGTHYITNTEDGCEKFTVPQYGTEGITVSGTTALLSLMRSMSTDQVCGASLPPVLATTLCQSCRCSLDTQSLF